MKLLFFHNDPKLLVRLMGRSFAAQNVVIPCTKQSELSSLVAATEPHLVVLAGDGTAESLRGIEATLREEGFHTRVLVLPRDRQDDRHLDAIWLPLRCFPREPSSAKFDPHHYRVLTEKGLNSAGTAACQAVDNPATQEDRFLALLQTGAKQHARAQAYLRAALATQRNYQREWMAAVLSAQPLAYLWRSQLFRYASTLAHYIPGVDTECLPMPHPPAKGVDYLPTALSPEAFYALAALRTFGINSGSANGLWSVGQFEARQGDKLPGEVAQLAGWAAFLREVARAHVRVVGACLREQGTPALLSSDNARPRKLQRAFCHWWRLTHFMESPEQLGRLAMEFNSGRRATRVGEFCSFYDFLHQIQRQNQTDSLARN